MVCVVDSQEKLSKLVSLSQNPDIAYIVNDSNIQDMLEPVMIKFLQRIVKGLREELK